MDGRESKALAPHHAMFAGGASNLENLDLRAATAVCYELLALPLLLDGLGVACACAALRPSR